MKEFGNYSLKLSLKYIITIKRNETNSDYNNLLT